MCNVLEPHIRAQGVIGLSYSPYLTVSPPQKRVYVKRYPTGELVMSTHSIYTPDKEESRQKPPENKGQRIVEGLSRRGKTRLRRSASLYDIIQGEHGQKVMITLTYGGQNLSDHETAKKDLDRFLKSMRRYVKKAYGVGEMHYVWVAEIQTKRKARTGENAIHFHIMTIYHIPKEKVNEWWNNAVNKPRKKKGLPTQKLLPNIISCFHAGAYMAKYLSKEGHKIKGNGYNMSQATSQALKPQEEVYDLTKQEVEEFYDKAYNLSRHHTNYLVKDDDDLQRMLWIPETNEHGFHELIESFRYRNLRPGENIEICKIEKEEQNYTSGAGALLVSGIEKDAYLREVIAKKKARKQHNSTHKKRGKPPQKIKSFQSYITADKLHT